VTIFERNFFAGDPHAGDVRADIEDAAVTGEESGLFAGFDGTEAVGDTRKLGRVKRDPF
jgi:hypothetical protein